MTEDDARLHRAPPPSAVSRRLQAMFAAVGESDYIGEPVSMMAHSLQAAALSAKQHGDNEVTVAALLHDVGHAVGLEAGFPLGMNDCGIPEHELVGEEFLEQLHFTPRIQKLVRHHVTAKRYLCFKKPAYAANLSAASRTTLDFQGGPMSAAEAEQFEADVDFAVIVLMRKWDEAAKVPGLVVPGFHTYFPLLDQYSSEQQHHNCHKNYDHLTLSPNYYIISTQQLKFFRENEYVKISSFIQFHQCLSVSGEEDRMTTAAIPANLWPSGLSAAVCGVPLRQAAAQLLGEEEAKVQVLEEDEEEEGSFVTAVVALHDVEGVVVGAPDHAGRALVCRAGDVVLLLAPACFNTSPSAGTGLSLVLTLVARKSVGSGHDR